MPVDPTKAPGLLPSPLTPARRPMFRALGIAASGLAAQRQRMEIVATNLANAEVTRTPDGGPYRRKDVVFSPAQVESPFQSILHSEMQSAGTGVRVSEIVTDTREPERRYLPGHPDADAQGYVAMPRMNPAEDMVDLMGASRAYEANVSAMSAVKDMIQRSMDLFK